MKNLPINSVGLLTTSAEELNAVSLSTLIKISHSNGSDSIDPNLAGSTIALTALPLADLLADM